MKKALLAGLLTLLVLFLFAGCIQEYLGETKCEAQNGELCIRGEEKCTKILFQIPNTNKICCESCEPLEN
ncbi:MAG: hypothetical protein JW772_03290 [Candidatus Diapherotrites archaeon]|nr:hypothetical protein [Candidatus Diapherotrites archaeon]